jgi:hypothetical protein
VEGKETQEAGEVKRLRDCSMFILNVLSKCLGIILFINTGLVSVVADKRTQEIEESSKIITNYTSLHLWVGEICLVVYFFSKGWFVVSS